MGEQPSSLEVVISPANINPNPIQAILSKKAEKKCKSSLNNKISQKESHEIIYGKNAPKDVYTTLDLNMNEKERNEIEQSRNVPQNPFDVNN